MLSFYLIEGNGHSVMQIYFHSFSSKKLLKCSLHLANLSQGKFQELGIVLIYSGAQHQLFVPHYRFFHMVAVCAIPL